MREGKACAGVSLRRFGRLLAGRSSPQRRRLRRVRDPLSQREHDARRSRYKWCRGEKDRREARRSGRGWDQGQGRNGYGEAALIDLQIWKRVADERKEIEQWGLLMEMNFWRTS